MVGYDAVTKLDDLAAALLERCTQQQGLQGSIQGTLTNILHQHLHTRDTAQVTTVWHNF